MSNLTNNKLRGSNLTNARFCDLVNLALGLVLISGPWLFGVEDGAQSATMIAGGAAVTVLSFAALAKFAVWEEWLNLLVGLWLVGSPFLLHFEGIEAARLQITVGIIVAAFAWSELRFRSPVKLS